MSTPDNSAPALSTPLRILVVDNDPEWRKDYVRNLEWWGYQAYAAVADETVEDKHASLLSDARHKARTHRCHIAIVDMRLKSDYDDRDTSGLALVSELAPTVSIIVTAFGTRQTTREALKHPLEPPYRAFDFIGKEDGPEALHTVIEEAAREVWKRRHIEFVRPTALNSAELVRRFFSEDESVPPDEIDEVLRRLFPDATRIKIEPVSGSPRASSPVFRRRSRVIKAFIDRHRRPWIVKLAHKGRIQEEINRFNAARNHFTIGRYAQPQGTPIELWDLGGTVYDFIGDDREFPVVAFSEYYATHDYEDVQQAISNFARFWGSLYQIRPHQAESRSESLFKAYHAVWHDEWCERLLKYSQHPSGVSYPSPFDRFDLPQPIDWLIHQVKLTGVQDYNDSATPETAIALTHGDLQGDNLFVDTRHDIWVIDYERTGFGPILQDWVELENDILTQLAGFDSSEWPSFCSLLCEVLAPQHITLSASPPGGLGSLYKEWQVTSRLRELAVQSCLVTDGRQYLWGLLLNAIFRLTLFYKEREEILNNSGDTDRGQTPQTRLESAIQRCHVLAGMICHRLAHWSQPWPAEEWKSQPGGNRGATRNVENDPCGSVI